MAPRKKRTAAKSYKTKRGRPKLPEGDLDTSMTAEDLEIKLKNYTEDYQLQVEGKLDQMRKYIQTLKGIIANCYRSTMIELLKSVKEMTMEEFMSKGGRVDVVVSAQVRATVTGLVINPVSALGVTTNDRLPLANVSNSLDIAGSCLDQSSMMNQLSSNVQTAGKSTRTRKAKADARPPPSGTRSSRRLQAKSSGVRNELITPMTNMSTLTVLNPGLFITPKFDPRKPVPVESIRQPKAGEWLVSLAGSPLANNLATGVSSAPQVIIPLTGGKTMQLSVDDKQSINDQKIDVANDSVAQQNIRLLQEKLSRLLKMPKE